MAKVKNWVEFQHYKNRCPPWIKLQKSLLDDFDFACLPLASKALAPLLWLLASETMDGEVTTDPERIAFRLRWPVADVVAGLGPLIDKGFLIGASSVLAACKQVAPKSCSEGEAEAEGERTPSPPAAAVDFKADLFARWKALPESGGGAFGPAVPRREGSPRRCCGKRWPRRANEEAVARSRGHLCRNTTRR